MHMLSSLVMELMEYSKNTITVSHRYEAVIFILLLFCVDHKHYAKLTIIEARTSNFECANLESGCKIKGRHRQMVSDLPNNLRYSVFFFLFVQSSHVSYSFGHFFAHLDRFNDFKLFSMP